MASPEPGAKRKIEFNRDVRPIITKCFTCHGHDPQAIMAGLRLDRREGALAKLADGKRAIVPGHPEESELIRRINTTEESELMPPAYSNKTLSEEEKHTLEIWIAEGAEYKEHWAFVPPSRPALPALKKKDWTKGPIDFFILSTLEENKLGPSPQADRRTLIRRVSLDLVGLPPTPEEVDAFVNDKAPNAYEKVVDRLLASPRYGERMAMDWMDYARYADSNGYQADYERYQWRWRDWVIDAFNQNMPYDQFTVKQLAGDLLPNASPDDRLATGFNRNHRINTEGGVIAEEWRVETVIDRVETTSQTWLGLTTGCARCHDHKYDPITQKEFYALGSYFNNVPESGTGVEQPVNHPPLMKAPTADQSGLLRDYQRTAEKLQDVVAERLKSNANHPLTWSVPEPPPVSSEGLIGRYQLKEKPALLAGTGVAPTASGSIGYRTGRSTGSVSTGTYGFVDLGDVADFERNQAYSYGAWVFPNDDSYGTVMSRMESMKAYRGWDISLQGRQVAVHLIHNWPKDAIKLVTKEKLPAKAWSHVLISYDGSGKAAGFTVYVDGKKAETAVDVDALTGTTRVPVHARVGRRTDSDFYTGRVDDPVLYSRAITADEAAILADVHPAKALLAIPPEKRTVSQVKTLDHLWAYGNDPVYKAAYDKLNRVRRDKEMLEGKVPSVMVMAEMDEPRNAYVLIRGQYNKRGDKVTAGVPSFLPPVPSGLPNNRLGFAKWIVSPTNPLTARVAVNRMWERLFGRGIVGTSEDFGTRADFPSHPELLDWLASEFVRLKWNQKALWKQMVMSATYRQSSRVTPALLKVDPENKLLARGPRFRLPGEVIRDQALAAGGLLVHKIGGPSVRPYQLDGVWDELNVYGNLRNYKHDTDAGLHRRSLYTIWKRTAAPPNMTLFDVPSRETCRVVRARTNTPLQALNLLNDVTYLEAAKALAELCLKQGGPSSASRLDFAFRRVVGREPSLEEARILGDGLAKRLTLFRSEPDRARKLVALGDYAVDAKLDVSEVAAYAVTASTLLNLDEVLTKE